MKHSVQCRCKNNRCRARVTITKAKWHSEKEPKCHRCGGELKIDTHRMNKENKKPCNCHGYMFPHRKGGGVWCVHSLKEPTEQDVIDRYGPEAI